MKSIKPITGDWRSLLSAFNSSSACEIRLTGLSGSGKTTMATLLEDTIESAGFRRRRGEEEVES